MNGFRRPYFRGRFRGRISYSKKSRDEASQKKRSSNFKSSSSISSDVSRSLTSQTDSFSLDSSSSGFLNQKALPIATHDKTCPYPGWLLYFPTRNYDKAAKSAVCSKIAFDFICDLLLKSGFTLPAVEEYDSSSTNNGTSVDWIKIETQGAVLIDYSSIINSSLLQDKLELNRYLGDNIEGGALCAEQCDIFLSSLGLALHTLCYRALYKINPRPDIFKNYEELIVNYRLPSYIAGRIINHSPITPLRKLRAHHLGRFISVKGIVVRLGSIEPACHRLVFECVRCESKQVLILPSDGRYSIPAKCPTRDCRSRSFEPLLNHPDTLTIDMQIITIQEACEQEIDDNHSEANSNASSIGRSSRCLTCRLTRDLVDSCIPGDIVHVAGTVGLISTNSLAMSTSSSNSAGSSWSNHRGNTMYSLLIDANSLICLSGSSGGRSLGGNVGSGSSADGSRGLLVLSSNESDQSDGQIKGLNIGKIVSNLDSDFTLNDLYAIREISEQPNLFRLLVASLCPTICGRGLVKAGLILALFGGSQSLNSNKKHSQSNKRLRIRRKPDEHKNTENNHESFFKNDDDDDNNDNENVVSYRIGFDKTKVAKSSFSDDLSNVGGGGGSSSSSTTSDDEIIDNEFKTSDPDITLSTFDQFNKSTRRSASHLLIVGDPGLGKSQLLRAAANLAPRVLYVCGNTATAAGLTVSTIRENSNSGGGFGLEAGALVLADQGCCCIDEFDKLTCDPAVLLEAMEQQTISVARGGLVANLPARAAVLAAANPIGGHYDITRRLDENLKIPPALLSRFDLIFVLLDRPDEIADRLLSEHVTAIHTGNWKTTSFNCTQFTQDKYNPNSLNIIHAKPDEIELDPNLSLNERLELRIGEQLDYIPPILLRKYIMYARKYVMPSLSTEAAMTLRDFYLELRQLRHSRDTFPVTMRQLESLIRLTQARARAELREEATKQDALDVCELMRATGLGTGHVGGTPANASLSQIASVISSRSNRCSSNSTGPAAAKRLLAALEIASQQANSKLFTLNEISQVANAINVNSTCITTLLDRLNEAGALIKRGTNLYKIV